MATYLITGASSQDMRMAQGQPAISSALRLRQEASEAEIFTTLDRFNAQYEDLEAKYVRQGYELLLELKPVTQSFVGFLTGARPRYAASLDRLSSSPWKLYPANLVAYFGESVFTSDSFIVALDRLASTFAKSHD